MVGVVVRSRLPGSEIADERAVVREIVFCGV